MTPHYCAQKIPSRKAKYTQKEVLDRFVEVHGNKYDYSQFSFQTLEGKSKVICKIHGPFSISAKHHWQRKQGCGLCAGRLLSLAERINQFKVVHGNKYDYSRFCTTRAEDKGVVICRLHGEFLISGRDHKQGKGCKQCGYLKNTENSKRKGKQEFVKKAKLKHGNKFNYSDLNYFGDDIKTEFKCPIHGPFLQTPKSHLKSETGCWDCGLEKRAKSHTNSTESFIIGARVVHGDTYDYSKSKYKRKRDPLIIGCRIHGEFLQAPAAHVGLRQGCPSCARERVNVFRKEAYTSFAKKKYKGLATLYVLRCSKGSEVFYKVGITARDISYRYRAGMIPYEYDVIVNFKEKAEIVWDFEKRILGLLSNYRYEPKLPFAGRTECFSKISKPVQKLLKQMEGNKQLQLVV